MESSPPRPSWRSLLLDVLLILGLVWKATAHVASTQQLEAADELAYLISGYDVPLHGLPSAAGGPFYTAWYWLLSYVCHEPTRLIAFNWSVLAGLLCLSLYLLARALGGTRVSGLLAAGIALTTTLLDVWPHPMQLAASVVLLGLAGAVRWRKLPGSCLVLGLALLTASYIRPELSLAFLAFCPLSLIGVGGHAWRKRRAVPALGYVCGLGLATALALHYLGNPLGGNRSIAAFGQHYAVVRVKQENLTVNPWFEWESFIRRDFGDVHSVGEAGRAK